MIKSFVSNSTTHKITLCRRRMKIYNSIKLSHVCTFLMSIRIVVMIVSTMYYFIETESRKNPDRYSLFICIWHFEHDTWSAAFKCRRKIHLFSDAAGSQNKNLFMVGFCSWFASKYKVKIVHWFPERRHIVLVSVTETSESADWLFEMKRKYIQVGSTSIFSVLPEKIRLHLLWKMVLHYYEIGNLKQVENQKVPVLKRRLISKYNPTCGFCVT